MATGSITTAASRRRSIPGDAALIWLIPAALYYGLLLTAGSSGLFGPVTLGHAFNSMLLHLLHGRFDVDPATIGGEGYLRDGAVYAYFGIFPALFRALFLWLPNFATTDFTRVACLAAVVTMAGAKVMSVRLMWRQARAQAPSLLLAAMIAAVLLSGPQVQFLRPSIYQEVELWAGAFSAIFVYLVLRGLCDEDGFSPPLLTTMAAVAGLCLLTRVSNALGLYAAFGFIWLCVAWRAWKSRRPLAGLVLPISVLAVFVVATAVVNAGRWGNPLVFADFTRAMMNDQYPGRLERLQLYGEFNHARIGYLFSYYFAPFWVLRDAAGSFLWAGFEGGYAACCVELPPGSFLISDPLLIGLCVYGMGTALRKGAERRDVIAAAGLGLLLPILLILTAFSASHRYRMEFYPFFELFAFLGFARLAARPAGHSSALVGFGALVGILTGSAMWMLYMLSPFGPAGQRLGSMAISEFYLSLFK
jgi:hypothetical protein